MPKRNAKSHTMHKKSRTWIAKFMEERTENVSGCCGGLAHPRNSSGSAMWCLRCRSGIIAATVWRAGALNVDISIQGTMINIHFCALVMGISAEMLHRCWSERINEQEWSLHFPLRERELRTCMQVKSWQSGWTC